MAYSPLTLVGAVLSAVLLIFTAYVAFGIGNQVSNALMMESNNLTQEEQALNQSLPYQTHVNNVDFITPANTIASFLSQWVLIFIALFIIIYAAYASRR